MTGWRLRSLIHGVFLLGKVRTTTCAIDDMGMIAQLTTACSGIGSFTDSNRGRTFLAVMFLTYKCHMDETKITWPTKP